MIGASRAASTRAYQVLSTTNITSTGSQNYTVPEATVYLEIEMFGGGGGGGAGKTTGGRGGGSFIGGGGGGGSYVKHKIFNTSVIKDAVVNFTVGAGGAGGAGNGANGASTTLNTITPDGGSEVDLSGPVAGGGERGGEGEQLNTNLSDGGVAANGNITNTNGGAGVDASVSAIGFGDAAGGDGGDSPNGGAGGDGGSAGGGGQVGDDGTAPGGGGGGGCATNSRDGGDGAAGKVIVKAFG